MRRSPASRCPRRPRRALPLTLTNTSDRKLYVTVGVRAMPRSGEEDASANGLTLDVDYSDADGKRGRRATASRRAATSSRSSR